MFRYIGSGRSARGEYSAYDIKSLLIQVLIVCAGAALTVVGEWVSSTDFGVWGPTIVAGWTVLANIIRKGITDYTGDTDE